MLVFSVRPQRDGTLLDNEYVDLLIVLTLPVVILLYFKWCQIVSRKCSYSPVYFDVSNHILMKPQSYMKPYLLMSCSNMNLDSCIFDRLYRHKRGQFPHTSLFLYICFFFDTRSHCVAPAGLALKKIYMPLLCKYCFKGVHHHIWLKVYFTLDEPNFPAPPTLFIYQKSTFCIFNLLA